MLAGKPDWEKLFAGYTATVDAPGCEFVEELMARYPDAKVILNVRDADKWYKSMHDTVYQLDQVGWRRQRQLPGPPQGTREAAHRRWPCRPASFRGHCRPCEQALASRSSPRSLDCPAD